MLVWHRCGLWRWEDSEGEEALFGMGSVAGLDALSVGVGATLLAHDAAAGVQCELNGCKRCWGAGEFY